MKIMEIIEPQTQSNDHEDDRGEADSRLLHARRQNAKLLKALQVARDEIAALRDEAGKLSAPPSTYGVYLSAHEDTVDVLVQGRKVRVRLHPAVDVTSLRPGQQVLLND